MSLIRTADYADSKRATTPRMLVRSGQAIVSILLNWGLLVCVVIAVIAIQDRDAASARAPLPPPRARLSASDVQQWRDFPSYHGVIPVLLYHGINTSGQNYSVTPRLFAQQMMALHVAGFHAITLRQYAEYAHGERANLPAKPILLTFDDGRLDAYREATRLLRQFGFHAAMFTFASWPTAHPGFSLNWGELQRMQRSGIWTIQEHGGTGHEYIRYNAAGAIGGVYANREYLPASPGHRGHLESFRAFVRRVTGDIEWGNEQLKTQIPGYQPISFAVPYANFGQEETNDKRIPPFMLRWLDNHFSVLFGGDYLDKGRNRPYQIAGRFSSRHAYAYRMTMGQRMQLPALYCRLYDWATRTPIWREYRCLHLGNIGAYTTAAVRRSVQLPPARRAPSA